MRPAGGLLFVVSSPSGAGKTTLCRRLVAEFANLRFSVSTTTRPPRPGERDGADYTFVDAARFQELVAAGALAEWAWVHDNRYGTTMAAVREATDAGHDVLFDIDVQGARQLRARFPLETVTAFILPPSLTELEHRLRGRALDDPEAIERRLARAQEELRHYDAYDFLIVNDELEPAYDRLRAVYLAAHAARQRCAAVAEALLGRR